MRTKYTHFRQTINYTFADNSNADNKANAKQIKSYEIHDMAFKIFLVCLLVLFVGLTSKAQIIYDTATTLGNRFDTISDNFGNAYHLNDIKINPVNVNNNTPPSGNHQVVLNAGCTGSYFNLWFDNNWCSSAYTPAQQTQIEHVIEQVFCDISHFINPQNPNQKVDIWIRDFNGIGNINTIDGYASSFYYYPNGAIAPHNSGVADNTMWVTINSGTNAWTNVANPLTSNGVFSPNSANYYHGFLAMNFSNNLNWHFDLSTPALTGELDLYTAVLKHVTHALGISSLISQNGSSVFTTSNNYYSRYDMHLTTNATTSPANTHLIANTGNCSMYNFNYNTAGGITPTHIAPNCTGGYLTDNTNCTTAINFSGATVTLPVYTPNCFEPNFSLSHFEDMCFVPSTFTVTPTNNEYYVVSNNQTATQQVLNKRYLKEEERKALADLGYGINTTYGNATNLNNHTYTSGTTQQHEVVGICDIIQPNFPMGGGIYSMNFFSELAINDYNASGFECFEEVYNLTSNLVVNFVTGDIDFSPSSGNYVGKIVFRYVPISPTGVRGNITYVIVTIEQGMPNMGYISCTPNICNIITNDGFESTNFTPNPPPNTYAPSWTQCGSFHEYNIAAQQAGFNLGWWIPTTCWTNSEYVAFYSSNSATCNNPAYQLPNNITTPPLDSWNPGATNHVIANMRYSGNSANHTTSTLIHPLSVILSPNTNYILSFKANCLGVNNNGLAHDPAHFQFGFDGLNLNGTYNNNYIYSNNLPSPIFFNTGLPVMPDDNTWHSYAVPFTTPNLNTLNVFFIELVNNTLINNTVNLFIDDIQIIPLTNYVSFNIPPCITPPVGSTTIDVSVFISPIVPNGTFSGNGIIDPVNGIFDPSVAGAGVHIISYTYTDNLGCPRTVSSAITTIGLSLTATTIDCNNPTSTITANASFGTTPYTYALNGGAFTTSPTFTVTSGTYTVTAQDALGCSSTSTILVGTYTPINITATFSAILCNGGTSTITANATGGNAPYTYALNGGAFSSNNIFANNTAGVYTISVQDAINCSTTTTVTVTQPNPLTINVTANPQTICAGSSTILIPNGGTSYTLNPSGAVSNTTFTVSPTTNTTYTITGVNANGCTATKTISVTVTTPPTLSLTPVLCASITQNGSFTVSTNATTFTVIPPVGTTYTITGTSVAVSTLGIYTVSVANVGCPAVTATVSIPLCGLCPQAPLNATVLPTNLIASSAGISALTAGTYIIDGTNNNFDQNVNITGCTIFMTPNASIFINNGSTLTIDKSTVRGCDAMWDKIEANQDNEKIIIKGSIIRDGKNAITIANSASLQSTFSKYYDNGNYCISITNMKPSTNQLQIDGANEFKTIGTLLPPSTVSGKTTQGIHLTNCFKNCMIGGIAQGTNYANHFDNLIGGVNIRYSGIVSNSIAQNNFSPIIDLQNNKFTSIQNVMPVSIYNNETKVNQAYTTPSGAGVYVYSLAMVPTMMANVVLPYINVYNDINKSWLEFNNCDKAIVTNGRAHLTAHDLFITDCLMGIMNKTTINALVDINHNKISNSHIGIQSSNRFKQLFIRDNHITTQSWGIANSVPFGGKWKAPLGIDVSFASIIHQNVSSVHLIERDTVVILAPAGYGTRIRNASEMLAVNNNMCYFNTTYTGQITSLWNGGGLNPNWFNVLSLTGFDFGNSDGVIILENHTRSNTFMANSSLYGARASRGINLSTNCKNYTMMCNTVKGIQFGIRTEGTNTTGKDRIKSNKFDYLLYGLVTIDNGANIGTFGDIGSLGHDNENNFMYSFGSPAFSNYINGHRVFRFSNQICPNYINTNSFYLTSTLSGANNPNNKYNVSNTSGSDGAKCGTAPNMMLEDENGQPIEMQTAIDIAEDDINYLSNAEVADFINEHDLYASLDADSLLRASNTSLSLFYNTRGLQQIGTVHIADEMINLLANEDYTNSLSPFTQRYADALSANSAIQSNDAWIANEEDINAIELKIMDEGTEALTSTEIQAIQDLAILCPYEAGTGVFKARALWNIFEPNAVYNDLQLCSQSANKGGMYIDEEIVHIQNSLQQHEMVSANIADNFEVYPNPVQSQLNISYNIIDGKTTNLYLYNSIGQLVKTITLQPHVKLITTYVNDLQEGVYSYKVLLNGKNETGKIIIKK